MRTKLLLFILIALIILSVGPSFVLAAENSCPGLVPCGCSSGPPCNICHIFTLIQRVLNFLWWYISIPLATLMLAYAGFLLMIPSLGSGSPPMITKGKKVLKNTVVGIMIVFFSWLFIDTIIKVIAGQNLGSGTAAKIFGPWNEVKCSVGSSASVPKQNGPVVVTENPSRTESDQLLTISDVTISKQAIKSLALAQTASWQASLYDSEQKKLTDVFDVGVYLAAIVRKFLALNHDIAITSDFTQRAIEESNAILSDPNSNQISRQIALEARFIAQHSFRVLSLIKTQSAAADVAQNYSIKASTIASIVKAYINFAPGSINTQKAKEIALLLDGYPFVYSEAVFSVPLPNVRGSDFTSILNSYKAAVRAQLEIIELIPTLISRYNDNVNKNLTVGLGALFAFDGGGGSSDTSGDADAGIGGGIGPGDAGDGNADAGGGAGTNGGGTDGVGESGDNTSSDADSSVGDGISPGDDSSTNTDTDPGTPNSPGDNAENTAVAENTIGQVVAEVDTITVNPSTDEETATDLTDEGTNMANPSEVAGLASLVATMSNGLAAGNPGNPAATEGAQTATLGSDIANEAAATNNIGLAVVGLEIAVEGLNAVVNALAD